MNLVCKIKEIKTKVGLHRKQKIYPISHHRFSTSPLQKDLNSLNLARFLLQPRTSIKRARAFHITPNPLYITGEHFLCLVQSKLPSDLLVTLRDFDPLRCIIRSSVRPLQRMNRLSNAGRRPRAQRAEILDRVGQDRQDNSTPDKWTTLCSARDQADAERSAEMNLMLRDSIPPSPPISSAS